ncbi:MAG TPA: helix-turn-helix domain-containing protein [Gemmatimonadaceae bacterium]|nr:helix-turn-helix domain-containing protein [Gemmatimonadaceae bacterium]
MIIRTASELGHLVRDRRRSASLTQEQLAKRIGVSRQWVVDIERGKSTAALSLVLRTLNALGIRLDARPQEAIRDRPSIDLNAIIEHAKSRR